MRRTTRAAAFVGAAAMVGWVPLGVVLSDSAAGNSQWGGTAAADGVRVGVTINDFLFVSNVVDAGGPTAQATAGSVSGSRALAAYPYPGEIAMTAHGQTSGAAPNYPLVAQSNNGGPEHSEVQQGPYDLRADSTDDTSTADAHEAADGGGAGAATTQSQAQVVHDTKTGVVTSTAELTVDGFSVNGVLSFGRVHSYAQISSPSSEKPTTGTEFGDVRIGAQEVGVTDKGLVLPGTDVPLPPDSTANAMLSSAGITVHYLAGSSSKTTAVAPGLSITALQQVPGVGPTTVTYVIGQAAVSAQPADAIDTSPASTGGTLTSVGTTKTTGSNGTPTTTTPGASTAAPAAPAPAGDVTGVPASSDAAPPVTAPAPNPTVANGYRLAAAPGPSSASFYLVIAVSAIVTVAAAQLFRILAVKLAWT